MKSNFPAFRVNFSHKEVGGTKGSMETSLMGFLEGSPGNIGLSLSKKAPFPTSSPPYDLNHQEYKTYKR